MYAAKREGDLVLVAPVSVVMANELFLAWTAARRDRARRAERSERIETTLGFPKLTGLSKDVVQARDHRAQLVGIVLEVISERFPWIESDSAQAGIVLEYLLALLRKQTSAAWWTARPTPELVMQAVMADADEQEFERLVARDYISSPVDLLALNCPDGCGKFHVFKSTATSACPRCGVSLAVRTCTSCAAKCVIKASWEAWTCSCGHVHGGIPAQGAPVKKKNSLGSAFARGFMGG